MTTAQVKGALVSKGLKDADIAKLTGASRSMVSMVRRGRISKGETTSRIRTTIANLLEKPEEEVWG
jgi:predicted transcriptional regulator